MENGEGEIRNSSDAHGVRTFSAPQQRTAALAPTRYVWFDHRHQRTAAAAPAAYVWFDYRLWLLAFILAVVTFAAYQPTWHAGFIWDDDTHVTENANLRSLRGLYRIWFEPLADQQYYPLQLTSFWVEYHLWGLRPFGYHAVNILLHVLNALLLWMVLQQLEMPGAWLAAAIFAVHPVQVESVAWISELKNLLSTTFYLGALLAFLRFRPLTGEEQAGSPSWGYYALAIGLFLCALLSKTVACTLPAVLVLLLWWKRGRVERQDIGVLSPMFLLGITFGLMTAWLEKHHVGASGPEWSLSFLQRCLLAGRALWFYAGKLVWPRNFTFIYPRWEIDARVAWQYLFPVTAVVVLGALWWLRSRIGRGPLVAVLCFAGTLMPALGFFDVFPFRYSYVADHFQYLACIGLISLAVSTGAAICKRAGQWGRNWGTLAAGIALLILGVFTWRQARIYQNSETQWGDTLMKNPQCWMAHYNLGNVFMHEGKVSDAIGHYERALWIKSDFADAHNNLGTALYQTGRRPEAVEHFERALRIKPDYADAHYNLGTILAETGKVEEAIAHFALALGIKPDYAEAHYNLGTVLAQTGKVEEAIAHYEQALRIKPDFTDAQNALAQLQAGQTGR